MSDVEPGIEPLPYGLGYGIERYLALTGPRAEPAVATHSWQIWRTKVKKKDFDGLMRGLREARAYAHGKPAAGTKVHVRQRVDVAAIGARTGLSQDAFARRIGVSIGTLRNSD